MPTLVYRRPAAPKFPDASLRRVGNHGEAAEPSEGKGDGNEDARLPSGD